MEGGRVLNDIESPGALFQMTMTTAILKRKWNLHTFSVDPSLQNCVESGTFRICRRVDCSQEGEVNTADLADPMIPAIMTSRRKKRANAQIFENGVVASGLNNFSRWISPTIPASGGVVFES